MDTQFKAQSPFEQSSPLFPLFVHDFIPEIKGGVTIAYSISRDGDKLYYAIARCHKNDQYNKKVGRQIAVEHASEGKIFHIDIEDVRLFLQHTNLFYKYYFIEAVDFNYLNKKFIGTLLRLSIMKVLGKKYFAYDLFKNYYFEEDGRIINPCMICPNYRDAVEFDETSVCDGCDLNYITLHETELEDETYDFEEDDDYDDYEEDENKDEDELEEGCHPESDKEILVSYLENMDENNPLFQELRKTVLTKDTFEKFIDTDPDLPKKYKVINFLEDYLEDGNQLFKMIENALPDKYKSMKASDVIKSLLNDEAEDAQIFDTIENSLPPILYRETCSFIRENFSIDERKNYVNIVSEDA